MEGGIVGDIDSLLLEMPNKGHIETKSPELRQIGLTFTKRKGVSWRLDVNYYPTLRVQST